jgi:hypothetical protein
MLLIRRLEERRADLLNRFGKESEADMTEAKFDAVIDEALNVAAYLMTCKQKLHG